MTFGGYGRGMRDAAHRAGHALANQFPNVVTPATQRGWSDDDTRAMLQSIPGKLDELVGLMTQLVHTMQRKDTLQIPIAIGGNSSTTGGAPYILRVQGYRHSRLFVGGATTLNLTDPPGTALTLAAGWNLLDLRDGCELSNNGAAIVNALLELTDELVVR